MWILNRSVILECSLLVVSFAVVSGISAFNGTAHPPNWQKPVYELDPDDPENNGYENEDLIVWMRTAALPNFRKLYRLVNHTGVFENSLPAGNYTLNVDYS